MDMLKLVLRALLSLLKMLLNDNPQTTTESTAVELSDHMADKVEEISEDVKLNRKRLRVHEQDNTNLREEINLLRKDLLALKKVMLELEKEDQDGNGDDTSDPES